MISTWQGFVVPAVFLSLQPCSWDGRRCPIISILNFDRFPKANRCLFVRAIDGTAVNEGCNSVYLLPWLSFLGAEDVGPEKDNRFGFVSLVCSPCKGEAVIDSFELRIMLDIYVETPPDGGKCS